jgi:hypothetical protein
MAKRESWQIHLNSSNHSQKKTRPTAMPLKSNLSKHCNPTSHHVSHLEIHAAHARVLPLGIL